MKKFLALILCVMALTFAASCEPVSNEKLTMMAPDGAPALAVAKIMNDGTVGGRSIDAQIVSGADEIAAKTRAGEADISVMPINIAAKLYNAGVDIKLVSVNVEGCLYMVGKTPVASLNDLVGKVVYNIGEGGTPDLTFRYILQQNDIEYELGETAVEGKVVLNYVAAASTLIPLLKKGDAEYGIMGEPAVTNCNAAAGTTTVLNIQDEWKKITGEDYTQAGVVVKAERANDSTFMRALNKALSQNEQWCKNNAADIKEIITSKGSSLTVNFDEDLITRCNIHYSSADDAKANVEKYLNVLLSFDPSTIGGKLPDDGFYYGK